jgi:hypothetical protein
VRKVSPTVSKWASEMARLRWKGYTAEERRAQLRKASDARSARAAARRAAMAQADEDEAVSA